MSLTDASSDQGVTTARSPCSASDASQCQVGPGNHQQGAALPAEQAECGADTLPKQPNPGTQQSPAVCPAAAPTKQMPVLSSVVARRIMQACWSKWEVRQNTNSTIHLYPH